MKTRTWSDPVFGSQFVLMWNGTPAQFGKVIKRDYDPAYDGDVDFVGRCVDTNKTPIHTIIIMLPQWRRTTYGIATLVHELLHATERALVYRSIEHSEETSEVYAYFLDSLVTRCLDILP